MPGNALPRIDSTSAVFPTPSRPMTTNSGASRESEYLHKYHSETVVVLYVVLYVEVFNCDVM